jgi:phosphoribosylaminoimidazolecarboxamide formyltransferase/IMP cyclohydrolase
MSSPRRAIVSCYDKTGVVELAQVLREYDIEIVSTTGTLQTLAEAGIEAVNIGDYTGVSEMMDGRVKSLHAKIHAGLLGVRDRKLHEEQLLAFNYDWIDFCIVNPHTAADVIAKPNVTLDEVVDQVDIGGTAMIRSAAKNFRYVTVVINPERYSTIIHEMRAYDGDVTFKTRFRLAQEAFAATAEYDQTIAQYFQQSEPMEE